MKKLFIIFICFFIPLISSATLSMSPQQIDFVGNTNEKICDEVSLKTDGMATLIGEDLWAEEGYSERKLKQHTLESEELKLNLEYPKEIKIDDEGTIEVCLIGKSKGDYHGVLLYRIKDKPVRVGIWMNVSLEGTTQKITANIIGNEKTNSGFLFIIPIILLVVLGVLLLILKRK